MRLREGKPKQTRAFRVLREMCSAIKAVGQQFGRFADHAAGDLAAPTVLNYDRSHAIGCFVSPQRAQRVVSRFVISTFLACCVKRFVAKTVTFS